MQNLTCQVISFDKQSASGVRIIRIRHGFGANAKRSSQSCPSENTEESWGGGDNFFLYTVSHQRSSSQFPGLRKAHAVYFESCIPLIVKQSRDLDGKKLIVIPEASHFFSYIFAVAADIRLPASPEDSSACTFLRATTQTDEMWLSCKKNVHIVDAFHAFMHLF